MNLFTKLNKIIPSKYNFNILLLFLFAFIGVFLEIIGVGMIFPMVEMLLGKDSFIFDKISFYLNIIIPQNNLENKYLILYLVIGIYLIKNIILYLLHWFTVSFNVKFEKEISKDLINRYLNTNYIFIFGKSSSEIIRNLISECSTLNKKVLFPILIIVMDTLILIGIIFLLLLIEFKVTSLIIFLSISLILIYYLSSKKLLYNLGLQRQLYTKLVIKTAQETIHGLKLIKILKQENYFENLFTNSFKKSLDVEKKRNLILFAPKLITEVFFVIIFIFFIIFLLKKEIEFISIIPQLSIYFVAAVRMIPSINRMSLNLQTIKYGISSVDLLFEEFKRFENENKISTEKNKTLELNNNIELKNIRFSYNNQKSILKNINLKIKKGSMIGIVGQTGEGKSTLVNILIGLLKPTSGSIILDNVLFKDNLYDSKNFIGYVPQDTFLLDGTIKQNIVFTLEQEFKYDEKNFNRAIRLSKLEKFVQSLPNNINTHIGEGGSKLSGGQQQRISIARALYRDPKILIFDESTSSLDLETERQIVQDISQMKVNKTIILISHRESTLKHCDEIYKISDSKLGKIK